MDTRLEKMWFDTKSGIELDCEVYTHYDGSERKTYVKLNSLKESFMKYVRTLDGRDYYDIKDEGISRFDNEKERGYIVEIKGRRSKINLTPLNKRFEEFLEDAMYSTSVVRFFRKKADRYDLDVWFHYTIHPALTEGGDVFLLKFFSGELESTNDRVILCNDADMLKKMYDTEYWEISFPYF